MTRWGSVVVDPAEVVTAMAETTVVARVIARVVVARVPTRTQQRLSMC